MKKVLSVLLAAAMVMGMSVSSFALTFETGAANTANGDYQSFGKPNSSQCYHDKNGNTAMPVNEIEFANNFAVNGDWYSDSEGTWDLSKVVLNPGDVLTFVPKLNGEDITKLDSCWSINIKGNEYVKKAEFDWQDRGQTKRVVVKVTLVSDFDELDEDEISLRLYIADNNSKTTNKQSDGVKLVLPFDNYKEKYVRFDYTNDVDYAAKWIVEEGKKGTAVFDFEDAAYFTVKMIPEEEVVLNFSQDYNKDIDKAYNEYDAELEFYNFKGTKDEFTKVGELFIPADKDSFIYEIVDDELVEVDAEYVKGYKVDGFSAKNGWVIETKELGYYVVADEELVVAEEENKENTNNSGNKTNPETGANDFVGAAVALAVVSVAAAGALAFKK